MSDKHTRAVPVSGWCAGSFVCSEGMHDFIRVFSILLLPRIYVAGVCGGGVGGGGEKASDCHASPAVVFLL